MKNKILLFLLAVIVSTGCFGAQQSKVPDRFINKTLYGNIYPSTLNNTQQNSSYKNTSTKKLTTGGTSTSSQSFGKRKVVKRKTNARSATTSQRNVIQRPQTKARVATETNMYRTASSQSISNNRNVAARSTTNNNRGRTSKSTYVGTTRSSQTCFADYKECMEMYCQREDTAYNRCFCSAKLAQIDAKYQNKIDSLVQQIAKLKYDSQATDEEIKEYWDQTVGVYTNTNPWVNIDNALNINWADTEDRVRGQNAFNTGHEYCAQHLRSCFYMATNMRDAYKSEIARDCATYEQSLQRIQSAAESVIENYND